MAKLILLLCGVFCVIESAVIINAPAATPPKVAVIDDCKTSSNSLACVQLQLYRSMKSFFEQSRVDLYGGLSIIKEPEVSARAAKSLEVEETFSASDDFETRQTALESFAVENIAQFLQGRSLRWDPSTMVDKVTSTVRDVVENLPTGVQKFVTQLVTEGRGRKKKLQQLLPLLIGIKMKLGAALVIAALGVALLAKKAILASFISLAISIFIVAKKFLAQHHHHHPHHAVHHDSFGHHGGWAVAPAHGGAYSSPGASFGATSGGWDAATSYGVGDDTYASHSSPVAHKIAFSGQKPKRR